MEQHALYQRENVWSVFREALPPVMLAQLILALYNLVDSFFIGRFSGEGLTALSAIFPLQLLVTALAVGTGVGVNTLAAHYYGRSLRDQAEQSAGSGVVLAFLSWLPTALFGLFLMEPFARLCTNSPQAAAYTVEYGRIVCVGSLPVFLEGVWSKVHQARGNMRLPTAAQIAGALTNLLLDPLLIFGPGPLPALGVAGAAIATVLGQAVAAAITASAFHQPPAPAAFFRLSRQIYRLGYPSILMQSLYTVYILGLNLILTGFGDEAVTALGLYYKLQTFFFIPLFGLETCIVPYLSFVHAGGNTRRCRDIMSAAALVCAVFMAVAAAFFLLIPGPMIRLFTPDSRVLAIGIPAFRIIALSFLPGVFSLLSPVFFQAIGAPVRSSFLSVLRQLLCLVPIFWLLSRFGLFWAWFSFPLSEILTGAAGWFLYRRQLARWGISQKETFILP